jgi:hypothetical protein
MNKCNAITARGIPCGCKAKTNERCGKHTHTTLEASLIHIGQRIRAIKCLDLNNRTDAFGHVNITTIEQGLARIQLLEEAVRVDYPTWTGPITLDKMDEIRKHNPEIQKVNEAVARVPIGLRHQIPLLYQWVSHFHNLLIERYRVLAIQRLGLSVRKFYDPEVIRTTVCNALVDVWGDLHITQKQELHRCFTNLGILGQTEYRNLIEVLPLPVRNVVNEFVNDKQNVHRSETVSSIEKAFAQLKKVIIPKEQRTLGEILIHCRMKPEAEVQMVKFYHSGEPIYEHKNAYKRALDAVWTLVQKHENKKELYVRVADEMNDNIGMCAQGNLSRICNIMCGYLEEFKPPVPQGILVQNAIAAIAMDSDRDKIGRAKTILKELFVPENEWNVWLDALEE